jgi:VCBS repeat protein
MLGTKLRTGVLVATALVTLLGTLSLAQDSKNGSDFLEVYPEPPGIAASPQYSVQVTQNGMSHDSFVYQNQNPGYLENGQPSGTKTSSPLEKSTAWTTFSFSGAPVTVQITNSRPFTSARILPSHWNILPTIQGQVVSFSVTFQGQLAIDFCYLEDQCPNDSEWDISNPMLVFSNPPQGRPEGNYLTATPGEDPVPALTSSQSTVYFPPGVYYLGPNPYLLGITSGGTAQGAFIAAGAYVKGTFVIAAGASGTTIGGLGILSGELIQQSQCSVTATGCPDMIDGTQIAGNASIHGITIINEPWQGIQLNGTGDAIRNVKIISWMGNQTGIRAGAELDTGSVVESSFLKVGDDALLLISSNLLVSGCTIWQLDNAAAFELGANQPSNINHVTAENSDVIRTEYSWPNPSNSVFSANSGAKSQKSDFTFRNIHVENSTFQLFKMEVTPNAYTTPKNDTLGSISNLAFNSIEVADAQALPNFFKSFDLEHQVSNVTFHNVTVAGQQLASPQITFNANRNYSLGGTVYSGLLWRSQSEPQNFEISLFSGTIGDNPPTTLSIAQPNLKPDCQIQTVADFYGDGYASVLFLDTASQKLALWPDPALTYAVPVTCQDFPVYSLKSADGQFAGVGDFNGDGYADILLWNSSSQTGSILLMNGQQILRRIPVQPATSSDWSVAGVGDFNQTGYSDVLLRDTNGNLEVLYFGSSGYLSSADFTPADLGYSSTPYYDTQWPATSGHFDSAWTIVGIGDFNYSGYAQILWFEANTGEVGLTTFLGLASAYPNAKLPLIGTVFAQVPSGMEIQALGDFNGDNTADLLLRNPSTGETLIWYMGFFGGDLYEPGLAVTLSPDWQIQGPQ